MSESPLRVVGFDPGPSRTAWAVLEDGVPVTFGITDNEELLPALRDKGTIPGAAHGEGDWWCDAVAIERLEPRYGLMIGMPSIDTARTIGRIQEAVWPLRAVLLGPQEVLGHVGVATHRRKGEPRINADSGRRQAMLDRFGPQGTKRVPGVLYGISRDMWSALCIAVTLHDAGGRPA